MSSLLKIIRMEIQNQLGKKMLVHITVLLYALTIDTIKMIAPVNNEKKTAPAVASPV